jgi:hypothetical protein
LIAPRPDGYLSRFGVLRLPDLVVIAGKQFRAAARVGMVRSQHVNGLGTAIKFGENISQPEAEDSMIEMRLGQCFAGRATN